MQSLSGARFFTQPTGDASPPSASSGTGSKVAKNSRASMTDPVAISPSAKSVNALSGSGSGSNASLSPEQMQVVSRRLESHSKMKANARVSFVVNQKSILGNCVNISERFFPDLKSAKTASLAEAFLTTLYLGIAQDDEQEGYAKDSWLKISQTGPGISPDVSKNISKLTTSGEGMVNPYLVEYGAEELPNITELHLHNPMDSALEHLHLYKNLTSVTFDNSSLQETRESEATFNPNYRTIHGFSEASFVHLEKCPNLRALSLVNVETVSTAALVALCKERPLFKIQSTFETRPVTVFPPSSSAAEVGFVVRKYTFKDGHYSIRQNTTRTYEQASDIYKNTWDSIGRSLYAMLKTASGIQEIRIQRDMALIIDPKQVRAATVDGVWDEDSVKRPMDYFIGCPNLQDLTLCNVTKKALMSFRKLSQVKTLTINNSSFKEVVSQAIQRAGAKPSALEHFKDDTLFAFKGAKLKKITLIGCRHITDAAITYVNTTKKGTLVVERRAEDMPKEKSDHKRRSASRARAEKADEKQEKSTTFAPSSPSRFFRELS